MDKELNQVIKVKPNLGNKYLKPKFEIDKQI